MTVYLIGVEWIWDVSCEVICHNVHAHDPPLYLCVVLCYYNPAAHGISLRQQGPPSAQGKYCDIPLITIPSVELYRSEAKTSTTMITEEEERRILAPTTISTSAAAFRRCHRPPSKHRHCGALTSPDCRRAQICAAVVPLPPRGI